MKQKRFYISSRFTFPILQLPCSPKCPHSIFSTQSILQSRSIKPGNGFINQGGEPGQQPSFVAPSFCRASLTALKQKKSAVRPIAVGEIIRRLVAKCIAKEAASEIVDLFGVKQLGIAVKGGAESIVHATKIRFGKSEKQKA